MRLHYSSSALFSANRLLMYLLCPPAEPLACFGGAPRRSETRAGEKHPTIARADRKVRCGVREEHGGLTRHRRQPHEPATKRKHLYI